MMEMLNISGQAVFCSKWYIQKISLTRSWNESSHAQWQTGNIWIW